MTRHALLALRFVLVFGLGACQSDRSAQIVMPGEAAAPAMDPRDQHAEPAREDDEPNEEREVAQHITFDAGDASDVPAEGVVTQPQREPLPSMMSDVLYGPSK